MLDQIELVTGMHLNRLSNCIYVQALTYKAQVSTHTHTHTHTHATAFAPVPGGLRRRHELVVGPGRREQVEGNVVRHSRLEECDE